MSDTDHYTTPAPVIGPIREYLGQIDLDPCSNSASIVNARNEWMLEHGEDGLERRWHQYGKTAFVNCPYSPGNLPRWSRKCWVEHVQGMTVLLLIPVSTSTQWYHEFCYRARWHLYYKGRIQFGDTLVPVEAHSNRHDSVLVGFEALPDWNKLRHVFASQGRIVVP